MLKPATPVLFGLRSWPPSASIDPLGSREGRSDPGLRYTPKTCVCIGQIAVDLGGNMDSACCRATVMRMIHMLRMPAVVAITGRSRMSVYRATREGSFTRPVKIGMSAVGWPDYEVAALVAARVAGMTEEEIRALVAQLHEQRKTALDDLKLPDD